MSTSKDRITRQARTGNGGVIDYAPGMIFKAAEPVLIGGVRYAELIDGRVVRGVPYPRGLVWTGDRFEEREIRR